MAASDVRPLDNIILRVEVEGASEPGVSYHRISEKSGVLNPSMFKRWGSHLYRVQNITAGRPEAVGESTTITTRSKSGGQSVDLAITYRAFCPTEAEENMVARLGRYGDPSGELDKIITSTARELLWEQGDALFANLSAAKENLVREVTKAVGRETGLLIQPEVVIKHEEKLESISISQRIQVQFTDLRSKYFGVFFNAELSVDPRKALIALSAIPNVETLEARALDTVEAFFKTNVTAHSFAEGFRDKSVQSKLIEKLNSWLEPEGRCVAALELRIDDATHLPKTEVKLELNAEHKTLRSKSIVLHSDLILRLVDLGLYMRSDAKDVKNDEDIRKWVNAKFQTIVDRECLEKRRIDFLNDVLWTSIETSIKAEMENEVAQIGYEITQIVSEPLIPEREFCFPRNHRYEIEGLALRSTSDERVRVTVAANFYISKWEDPELSKKIQQDLDLEEDIKREIHDALTTVLVAASPDWFFLRFNRPEYDDKGDSLQDKLVDAVRTRLEDRCKCNVRQVSVYGVDNEDVRSIQLMLWSVQKRDFSIESNDLQGQPIAYSVHWKVTGLSENQWHRIINTVRNLDALNLHIEELLRGELALLSDSILRFTDEAGRDYILDRIQTKVAPLIGASFGLMVEFHNVVREKSNLEKNIGTKQSELLEDDINDNIAELEHRRKLTKIMHEVEYADLQAQHTELSQIRNKRQLLNDDPDNIKRPSARAELLELEKRELELAKNIRDATSVADTKNDQFNREKIREKFYKKANISKLRKDTRADSSQNNKGGDLDQKKELSESGGEPG